MNKIAIVLFAILALAAAETHNYYVGCHSNPLQSQNQFAAWEFFHAVEAANHHLDSRITICCFLELYNWAFDTIGPVEIIFEHNIELIGAHPKRPHTCPQWNVEQLEMLRLNRLNCSGDKTGNCMRANADIMEHEDFGDDLFEHPHAWIGTFGNWFVFNKKAKIERLGFIAQGELAENMHTYFMKNPQVNTTKFYQSILDNKGSEINQLPIPGILPNAVISISQTLDYSYEFSVEKSVFALSPFARFLTWEEKTQFFVWAIASLAQETVFEEVFFETLDFHLVARLSPVVHMSDVFMALYDNIFFEYIEYVEGGVKRQIAPWFYPQIDLKIDDSFIGFLDINAEDDFFPIAPVDLGVLSTYFPYLPEILRLTLDDVVWGNIDRFIAAGNYYNLLNNGFDFQSTHIDDRVIMYIPPEF